MRIALASPCSGRRISWSRAGRNRGDRDAAPGGRPKTRGARQLVPRDPTEPRRPARPPRVGRRIATMALAALLAVALLASVPGLHGVFDRLGHVSPVWILVAVALELASDISFVAVFRLFFDGLGTRDARLLAWTEEGLGALLPGGGAGGLAIGGWLIHLTGAPTRWIVRRSAGLFFLSAAVSSGALVGGGVALIAGARGPHGFPRVVLPTVLAAVATLLIASLPAVARSHAHAPRWLHAVARGVREAERVTFNRRPSWRLLGALGYLGFDVAVLWVALNAQGHAPSVAVVVLAYSIGYAANSLPVPGGIGVLDAGLTGALVLYGVSPVNAAAAVIVYHAVAFWVPGLGGLCAYLRLRPRLVSVTGAGSHTLPPTPQTLALEESYDAGSHSDAQASA